MTGPSPTVRQRELGKQLRTLRNERGMTVEDVADRLLCSTTKVSRLETGARRPSLRDVRDLCALYEVDEPTSANFMSLARSAREQGWWTQYADLGLDPLVGLEQEATAITCYSAYWVPGLLQTESYARAIIAAIAPDMDPAIHQQRVQARLRRQQLLAGDQRPRYTVLLDEAVLRRTVGGAELMASQLGWVLAAMRRGRVTVRVIPFTAGAHAAADSYFTLLEFGDSPLTPVVFLEGLTGIRFLERQDEIGRYREAISYLSDAALSTRDSASLMTAAAADLRRQAPLRLTRG